MVLAGCCATEQTDKSRASIACFMVADSPADLASQPTVGLSCGFVHGRFRNSPGAGSAPAFIHLRVLAEACASRTHHRHRRCRSPVLKTARVTGPPSLPQAGTTAFVIVNNWERGSPDTMAGGIDKSVTKS